MRDVNSPAARTAAVSLNVVCITYYNILPLVLGGAADTRGLDEGQLGFAAAAFMGGLALGNGLVARSRRHTSSPSIPGSIRSSRIRSTDPSCA